MFKNVYIIYNTDKIEAINFYKESCKYLKKKGVKILDEKNIHKAEFFIIIGGDGTLLHASHKIYKYKKPILGINKGNLGFLTEIKSGEAFQMYDEVLRNKFKVSKRKFIKILYKNKEILGLNEAVIAKDGINSKMINIKAEINKQYLTTYRADGVIVSTPTGSTAYSLSVGGPIISPELDVMIINPIAPHTLTARPLIVNSNKKIEFKIENNTKTYLLVDGRESIRLNCGDKIEITMSSEYIELIESKNRDYYSVLREKLKWGDTHAKRT
ncbi:NAD+ kinase [Hypnocyclicus thermotrophus]|uniref:NAD kinase n=1 Tax=Hypnocyclicus thermotrophus TaxID=1627895 RepID=A0AA46DZR6_9FUSO|nr:NAD(+)/NADH kinase [Hypnocyclicus thermotrophus]TDT71736.1 NAD+ kinase [Hypnocyclicus thermotrophus]